MRQAAAIEPTARSGQRRSWRIVRATAICTWLTSLVRRVTRVGAPKQSASRAGSESAARKRAPRASVPTPWATMEAIFWHTRVDA